MTADKATSLFWVGIAVLVAAGSYRLGLGTMSTPGSGFAPFGASLLLGLLSVIQLLQARCKGQSELNHALFRGGRWPRVILVVVALFAYARLVPVGGYTISTFLLMVVLFRVAGEVKLWRVAFSSLVATALSYYVFSEWLNLQFPPGPFGF